MNKNDWVAWARKNIPYLNKRTREKYMSIASIPMVEKHLHYGVERLAEFGTYLASLDGDAAKELGEDPLAKLVNDKLFTLKSENNSYQGDQKDRWDAILEVLKLERMNVIIPLEIMMDFLAMYNPLTGDEKKFLKNLAEANGKDAPVEHIKDFIANKKPRNEFVPKPETSAPATATATIENGEVATQVIPNIDGQLVSLSESIKPFLVEGVQMEGKVDAGMLDTLINDLTKLKARLNSANTTA
ncbi:hypothetical protein [Desulfarculus baarsii]